jgi:hypothetical protein
MNSTDNIIARLNAVVEADEAWTALYESGRPHKSSDIQEWDRMRATLNIADVPLFGAAMRSRAVLARELLTLLENDG